MMATKHVDRDGDPYLGLYRILGGAVECLYPEMLLDPFEKELDVPPTAVEIGNGPAGQSKIVGEKDESLVLLCIVVPDSSELGRIISFCVEVLTA